MELRASQQSRQRLSRKTGGGDTGVGSGCRSAGLVAVLTATSAVAREEMLVEWGTEGPKAEWRLGGRVACGARAQR